MKARIAASAALAVAIALGASACTFITPQATTESYDPSDGVSASVGNVVIQNALVISEDGSDGNLLATFVNTGDKPVSVAVQFDLGGTSLDQYVPVGAYSTVVLGGESLRGSTATVNPSDRAALLLRGIDTDPGALLSVFFQYGDETGDVARVPVLSGALEQYAEFVP